MLDPIITAFLCYIYGSIPFAYIYTYLAKGEKITELGSKNVGVANTFSVAGMVPGVFTVLGEISKGIVPILVSLVFYDYALELSILFVACSFVGTNFSIFLKFKGGMGFTIFLWSTLILSPLSVVAIGLIMFILKKSTQNIAKAISYSERTKYFLPIILYLTTFKIVFVYFGLVITIIYIIKRKQNMADIKINTDRTFNPPKKGINAYYKNHPRYIYYLDEIGRRFPGGNKANRLAFLLRKDFNLPTTMVCSFDAFEIYLHSPDQIKKALKEELEYYIRDELMYSVRSSANLEDKRNYSFAGQFKTFLDVNGIENVLGKICSIWDSSFNIKSNAYSENLVNTTVKLKMGVIIQEMVHPEYSGVVFTKNPVTGWDEIIIEAIEGLGIELGEKGRDPQRMIYKWGKWTVFPDLMLPYKNILEDIVEKSKKIEKKFGKPVDLEWAYDGKDIYWLQLRGISRAQYTPLYSNKMSREMMPGIIKPLIWSVNIPLVNTSWKKIFRQMIGPSVKNIKIEQLAHPFYYRSYFNMSVIGSLFEVLGFPRNILENLAGINDEKEGEMDFKFKLSAKTLSHLPRFAFFALSLFSFTKKLEKFLKTQRKKFRELEHYTQKELEISQCIDKIDSLFELGKETSYYVVICQLLNSIHARAIKKKLKTQGITYEKIDFSLINPKLRLFDPNQALKGLREHFLSLGGRTENFEQFLEKRADEDFKREYHRCMKRFGYLRDSGNDFSQPSWAETPNMLMKIISSPVKENHEYDNPKKIKNLLSTVFSAPLDKFRLRQSMRYLELREEISSLYSYGYGLFRPFFLRISETLTQRGIFEKIEDVFYLSYSELKQLINTPTESDLKNNLTQKIHQRRKEIENYRDISLPEVIYGEQPPDLMLLKSKNTNVLHGVPTSPGYYVGPVKVIHGLNQIDLIEEGDIIAIPFSDVSWTPLFNKVKGIISESGGILSHCSIVAREYKIPSIVSVEGAMGLRNGTRVAIDGYKGTITLIKKEGSQDKIGKKSDKKKLGHKKDLRATQIRN